MQLLPSHSILQILDALVSLDSLSAPSFQFRELPRSCLSPSPCATAWKLSLQAEAGQSCGSSHFSVSFSGINLPIDWCLVSYKSLFPIACLVFIVSVWGQIWSLLIHLVGSRSQAHTEILLFLGPRQVEIFPHPPTPISVCSFSFSYELFIIVAHFYWKFNIFSYQFVWALYVFFLGPHYSVQTMRQQLAIRNLFCYGSLTWRVI